MRQFRFYRLYNRNNIVILSEAKSLLLKRFSVHKIHLKPLLLFTLLASFSASACSAQDPTTSKLQQLINTQQAAKDSGDPAQVATASQKLTDFAEEQLTATTSALTRSNLSPAQKTQFQLHERQLHQVLGSGFNDWGAAEARLQQYAEALAHFQEAEKWDASTPGLMRNLGAAAFRLENYSESARSLKIAIDKNPGDQTARLMLAMSLFSLEKFADAAIQFAQTGDLAIKDARTAYAWAFSLARTNQQAHANQIADDLAARDLPPDVLMLVCQLYTTTENYEHAVPCFRKLSAENPTMPRIHYETGATLIHLDRPAEAIPELRSELKTSPDDVDAQYYLAYALLETSQRDEALDLLQEVVSEKPDYFQAQYELGKTLLENAKTAEAITHLEAAEKIDSSADYIHYQLQSAYRRAGRTEDANRELAIYKQLKASHRDIGGSHEISGP